VDVEAQSALLAAAEGVMTDAAAREEPLAGRRTFVAFSGAGGATRSRVRQLDAASGAYLGGWPTSAETDGAFQRLREAMFRPGEGTWYWMVLEIGPAGEVDARFRYEEPPEWEGLTLQLPPDAYREDLERFPRPQERLPRWLARLLTTEG
jgi:hypothetical protein